MLGVHNFDNEQTIIAKRRHWLNPFSQGITIVVFALGVFSSIIVIFSLFSDKRLVILSLLLVATVTIGLIAKIVIDWYFHFYAITTKRILEVAHSPIFFSKVDGLLLDQIRCIEIEERRSGPMKEIFDFGDVIVKYDSASRSGIFKFHNIPCPDEFVHTLNRVILPQNAPYQFQQIRRSHENIIFAN